MIYKIIHLLWHDKSQYWLCNLFITVVDCSSHVRKHALNKYFLSINTVYTFILNPDMNHLVCISIMALIHSIIHNINILGIKFMDEGCHAKEGLSNTEN